MAAEGKGLLVALRGGRNWIRVQLTGAAGRVGMCQEQDACLALGELLAWRVWGGGSSCGGATGNLESEAAKQGGENPGGRRTGASGKEGGGQGFEGRCCVLLCSDTAVS